MIIVNSHSMDKTSKMYAYYGYLCQFSITMNVDSDVTVMLGNYDKFIETWNRIGLDTVMNNANIAWGGQVIY